ncbi:hypothetical protein VNO77_25302 [Canavalia gladiata]|uniref:Pentatricopeptide repeat-containing protein n=1 Tax=Canavalia gladiata TaxID=3824 RepID=A0AAN9LB95_CANGL
MHPNKCTIEAKQCRAGQIRFLKAFKAYAQLALLRIDVVVHKLYYVGVPLRVASFNHVGHALRVFRKIKDRNVISWTTLISSYLGVGRHGVSLEILTEMVNVGMVFPYVDALFGVFVPCRSLGALAIGKKIHGFGTHGLGKLALKLLQEMSDSSIRLDLEHFSCVADMVAHAGKLEDYFHSINQIPLEPEKHMWGAWLVACKSQNVNAAKLSAENLIGLEPLCDTVKYILKSLKMGGYIKSKEHDGRLRIVKTIRT